MKVVCPHCFSVNNVPKKESYKKANCGKCKNSLLDTKPVELTNSNFDELIVNSELPVIVDYWAPWCGPCKMMAPNFTAAAEHFPLKAVFAKVNTEDEQNLGARFGIRSIPTLIVFKNGREVERVSGALPKESLMQLISKYTD
ncbi:thioredoxin TrxC [Sulfurimonas sp. C5]|uniref:thioredoxin TrxC n=1 Tax=Sulfurimonas sp. C5 TaxID=3036947 RepID=UPI002453C588|nr:thioredoxin TrxC [Sulfurimonas sp. C5]MDH4944882.1 thioredoxin TrxC [Sulfurimonas sp. C5]